MLFSSSKGNLLNDTHLFCRYIGHLLDKVYLRKFDFSIVRSCVLGIDQCIRRCTCQVPPFEGKGRYLHKVWLGIHQDLHYITNQSIRHHNYN